MSSRWVAGVTGHRPGRLGKEQVPGVRAALAAVLAALARAVSARSQEPWLVSALAEGADRLAAEEALVAGYRLRAVLPFSRAQYERDFKHPESLAEFGSLLARAAEVRELSGPPSGYAAVGSAVLDASELLLAVWDGERAHGPGGTQEVVASALARGLPVIWIPVQAPHAPLVLPGDIPFAAWLAGAWART
jgi:hypothetical protein